MAKIKTCITIEKDFYEKVKALGEKQERSFSQQLVMLAKTSTQLEIDLRNVDLRTSNDLRAAQ